MGNFYQDNDDLRFYVESALNWTALVEATELNPSAPDAPKDLNEAVSGYQEMLDLLGAFAADEVAPRAAELDATHPKLVQGEVVESKAMTEIFEQIRELGIHGLCLPRELGGLNSPLILYFITVELFARADVSVAAHLGFHGGMAAAALMYSVMEGSTSFDLEARTLKDTRFREAIDEIASGAAWGSMDITEPGAGSDMAALRTRGEQLEDGSWVVTGQKIFITSGHGKYHFVIARTEASPEGDDAFAGLKGLSMFLVPAYEDLPDGTRRRLSTLDGVEEKLGHSASATVSISFERTPAFLIGQRGEGFRYMLLLMNNARIGVGFESLGLLEAAWRKARAYAAERPSMGKSVDRHEMIADYLDEMRTEIQAIRAVAMEAAHNEELAQKLRMRLIYDPPADPATRAAMESQRGRHASRARRLTPLLKYTAAEAAVFHARRALQIHGGAGYIREYGIEKLLRDAVVFPIYEGTSQIQALMAMKDTLMRAVQKPDAFVKGQAAARWRALSSRGALQRRVAKLQVLQYHVVQYLITQLAKQKMADLKGHRPGDWKKVLSHFDPKRDFALAMLHAERLCALLSDVATAEVLYEVALRHPEREELLLRFLDRAEPRCRFRADEITSTGARLLAALNPPESTAEAAK